MTDDRRPFMDPAKFNFGRPFTPDTLSERWDCSTGTITRLCKSGQLRHFRVGTMYRIPADAVLDYEVGHFSTPSLPDESTALPEDPATKVERLKQQKATDDENRRQQNEDLTRHMRMFRSANHEIAHRQAPDDKTPSKTGAPLAPRRK